MFRKVLFTCDSGLDSRSRIEAMPYPQQMGPRAKIVATTERRDERRGVHQLRGCAPVRRRRVIDAPASITVGLE
jgi:hypothetical protein